MTGMVACGVHAVRSWVLRQQGRAGGLCRRRPRGLIVTDLNGTLTPDQTPLDDPPLVSLLRHASAIGYRLVLISGERLSTICGPTGIPSWDDLVAFDVIVGDGVLWDLRSNRLRTLAVPPCPLVVDEIRRRCQGTWEGSTSVTAARADAVAVAEAVRAVNGFLRRVNLPPLDVAATVDHEWMTLRDCGFDKGRAMAAAEAVMNLPRWGVRRVGFGNGIQDAAMLRRCDVAVLPSGASAELEAALRREPRVTIHRTSGGSGAAVREWLTTELTSVNMLSR